MVAGGAVAALGANAVQIAMCARARMFQPRSLDLRDSRYQRIGMCTMGGVSADVMGADRMLALGRSALRQVLAAADVHGWPLLLALPEPGRPDDDPRLDGALLDELADETGMRIDRAASAIVRHGRPGAAMAFERALDLLDDGAPGVVVGGIDSYFHPGVLHWLESEHRLHGVGLEDGFVPGEAAAFVALSGAKDGVEANARVVGVGHARDEAVEQDLPRVAEAMTRLVHAVQGTRSPWVINDVNGERSRVREWSLVSVRHNLATAEELRLPVLCGDVGAASGALMATIAMTWWQRGCAPANDALLMLHADGCDRGVIRLTHAVS